MGSRHNRDGSSLRALNLDLDQGIVNSLPEEEANTQEEVFRDPTQTKTIHCYVIVLEQEMDTFASGPALFISSMMSLAEGPPDLSDPLATTVQMGRSYTKPSYPQSDR